MIVTNSGPKWLSNLETGLVIKEKEMLTSCQKVDPTVDKKTPGIKLIFSTSRFRVYVLLSTG